MWGSILLTAYHFNPRFHATETGGRPSPLVAFVDRVSPFSPISAGFLEVGGENLGDQGRWGEVGGGGKRKRAS